MLVESKKSIEKNFPNRKLEKMHPGMFFSKWKV